MKTNLPFANYVLNPKNLYCLTLMSFLWPGPSSLSAGAGTLLGVEFGTGNLYEVSTVNASLSLIGNTGISSPASLEFAPNGVLYGFSAGTASTLYRINPNTAQSTVIGPLGFPFVFEGGLAFATDSTAYGVNGDSAGNPELIRLNLFTGQGTVIGTISGGAHDINGLAWRSDGMLVGLDRESNSLLTINPFSAASSLIAHLNPVVGAVGGMAALGDRGYFSTAGPGATIPGSNELYSFDLFSGSYTLIGGFSPVIQGVGIGGLALVPEPSACTLFGTGTLALLLLTHRVGTKTRRPQLS